MSGDLAKQRAAPGDSSDRTVVNNSSRIGSVHVATVARPGSRAASRPTRQHRLRFALLLARPVCDTSRRAAFRRETSQGSMADLAAARWATHAGPRRVDQRSAIRDPRPRRTILPAVDTQQVAEAPRRPRPRQRSGPILAALRSTYWRPRRSSRGASPAKSTMLTHGGGRCHAVTVGGWSTRAFVRPYPSEALPRAACVPCADSTTSTGPPA